MPAKASATRIGSPDATRYASISAPAPKRDVVATCPTTPIARTTSVAEPMLSSARKINWLADGRRTAAGRASVVCMDHGADDIVPTTSHGERRAI